DCADDSVTQFEALSRHRQGALLLHSRQVAARAEIPTGASNHESLTLGICAQSIQMARERQQHLRIQCVTRARHIECENCYAVMPLGVYQLGHALCPPGTRDKPRIAPTQY